MFSPMISRLVLNCSLIFDLCQVTRLLSLRDAELEGVRQRAETLMEKKQLGEGELRELSGFNEEMRVCTIIIDGTRK